jgi:hypothetical protein
MAKSVYEELYNLAYGWISYMNSEEVVAYNEQHLAAYKAGLEATPYKDVATGMICEEVNNGGRSSQKSRDIIGGYVSGQPINNKLVEQVITAAISDYLSWYQADQIIKVIA